ncbi:LuxR C-terminal-related transcriptional regulator [Erythrobacter sp. R86502]|uniref:LuxR C-terminal-related transcriptional regulator n=1 Tax=Erythrobacter sp. R86502 TaxID=3093846 RepID=UPI0036D2765D
MSDNALAREGMKRILEGEEFTVVGSHRSCAALIDVKAQLEPPQIVVVDLCDDDSVCAQVTQLQRAMPKSKVVVLSPDFDFDMMVETFRAGADGYIVKRIDCEPLIESLRLVLLGEKVMPSELATGLPRRWNGGSLPVLSEREVIAQLSDREIETLRFLILGSPNKVIAGHLDISEATVKVHVKAILRKLGAQNRTQAAIWAVNNGIELKQVDTDISSPADHGDCLVPLSSSVG